MIPRRCPQCSGRMQQETVEFDDQRQNALRCIHCRHVEPDIPVQRVGRSRQIYILGFEAHKAFVGDGRWSRPPVHDPPEEA